MLASFYTDIQVLNIILQNSGYIWQVISAFILKYLLFSYYLSLMHLARNVGALAFFVLRL